MRLLPRKRGPYIGPVVFNADGWHYPADHSGDVRYRLVSEVDGYRFARADDRNHNAIHEVRIVELGSPDRPIEASANTPGEGGPR
jgi:hypothetical protein